jgi:UDP-glucose:(heptosyl)LPS alpha-1,3-glucosyltransferase
MRIALSFPGCHRRGGVERVLVECANYLSHEGHEAHVFAEDIAVDVLDLSVRKHVVTASRRIPFSGVLRFGQATAQAIENLRLQPDVVASFGVVGPPGAVVWVQSVHAAWIEISNRYRKLGGRLRQKLNPFHPLILSMERSYFGERRYKRLIALTAQVKSDLVRFYDVPEGDVELLPNGFAPNEFNIGRRLESRNSIRKELGFRDEDRIVVFAANEMERKGFGPLLSAIASLGRQDVHLLAVGRLSVSAYASQIAKLGMTNRVRFTGPTGDVARFYACADVFGLPTQYEAWGLVVVEAMACGLPVLTSRLAGAAVAVREGWSGELLDDPRNVEEIRTKLSRLLDGHHAESLAISDSVISYRWDRLLQRYETILQRCSNEGVRMQSHLNEAPNAVSNVEQ